MKSFPSNELCLCIKILPEIWVPSTYTLRTRDFVDSYVWEILVSFSTICTLIPFYDRISASPTSDDRFVRDNLRAIDLDVTAHGLTSVWDL